MSLSDEQFEFAKDLIKLQLFTINEAGFSKYTNGELWRPLEMQKIYVETGRSKTMNSKHLDKLAWDGNFWKILPPTEKPVYVNSLGKGLSLDILKPLGVYWESLNPNNRWGGNFDKDWTRKDPWVDVPHFERNV